MMKYTAIALAVTMTAAVHAQTVSSEKTVRTETSTNGAVQATSEHRTETQVTGSAPSVTTIETGPVSTVKASPAYWTRLESAYKYAGVPEADIARLRDIDLKVVETRRTNPNADLNTYYVQQSKILQPAQISKVRTYLHEHRPATTVPAYEVTTYETVPAKAGVEVNTPIGSIGVGVPAGSTVIEKREVVPAN
jgi:hypothetical protein